MADDHGATAEVFQRFFQGAQVGNQIILTKPLGTGVIATAIKGRLASPESEDEAIRVMTALNLLKDVQTNGGLLLAVAADQAQAVLECLEGHSIAPRCIGEVTGATSGRIKLEA